MNKVVLLNGPPRSGKDTIANNLVPAGFAHLKFANLLKSSLNELLPSNFKNKIEIYKDEICFRSFEDSYSIRRLLIELSEEFIKPRLGKDYFGLLLADWVNNFYGNMIPNIVISDCGFFEEAESFIRLTKCLPLLVRVSKENCSFENDSRRYIHLPNVKTIDIKNDHEPFDVGIIGTILRELGE